MQLRHDRGRLGHSIDHIVGECSGMRAREPDSLEALYATGGPQKLAERFTITELDTV